MRHWTAASTEAFVHRISFDYFTQLVKRLDSLPINQSDLAKILDVSEGRISQTLSGSRNPTLTTIVSYARVLGLKVAIVAYDDRDPSNERGPINSEVFNVCWERANRPADFFALQTNAPSAHRPFNKEYVSVEGHWGHILPKTADNSMGASLKDSANLVLLCEEHHSTSGKFAVQYKDKMLKLAS
jgi:transcriptional regulator with XRE-family HTH domain